MANKVYATMVSFNQTKSVLPMHTEGKFTFKADQNFYRLDISRLVLQWYGFASPSKVTGRVA